MRMLRRRIARRLNLGSSEAGTTIVDVVTAMVIMGVVLSPIAIAVQQALNFIPDSEQRTAAAIYRSMFIDSFADDVATASSVTANGSAMCSAGATTTFATIARTWSNKEITYSATVGSTRVGKLSNLYEVQITRASKVLRNGTPETRSMLAGYCKNATTIASPVLVTRTMDQTVGEHQQLRVTIRLHDSMWDTGPDVFTLGSVVHKTAT